MNPGELTIDWLYRQLGVDEAWSVQAPNGFTWWADRHAQRVEVIGSEAGPDGSAGYFVRVKTDLVRDLTLDDRAMAGINLLMSTATMLGPVYDAETKVLSLASLVKVHQGIRAWMSPLISVAAMLQIADAHFLSTPIAETTGGTAAESGHPTGGLRARPDELAVGFTPLVAAAGAKPSAWRGAEFRQTVDQHMQGPPALLATCDGNGLTVEFPYGGRSSLCEMSGGAAHPRIGNGLLLLQKFPVDRMSDADGTRLALQLNVEELDHRPAGYGFGSYCYRDGCIAFTTFIPNAAYKHGLLPNLYFTCAARARAMSVRFTGDDWASGPASRPAIATPTNLGSPSVDRVTPCGVCGGGSRINRPVKKQSWTARLFGTRPESQKCPRCGGTGVAASPSAEK